MAEKTGLCLSVMQPWAWLIVRPDLTGDARLRAIGYDLLKLIENRDWRTRMRGWIGVHASKTFDNDGYAWVHYEFPEIALPDIDTFALGGIVGRANLVDCVTAHPSRWFKGTYGFVFEETEPLPFMPCRGMPGFFRPKL